MVKFTPKAMAIKATAIMAIMAGGVSAHANDYQEEMNDVRPLVMVSEQTSDKGLQDLNMIAIRNVMNFTVQNRVEKTQKALLKFFDVEGRKAFINSMTELGFFKTLKDPINFSMTTAYLGSYDDPKLINQVGDGWQVELPVSVKVKDSQGAVMFEKQVTIQTLWQASDNAYGMVITQFDVKE